MPIYTESCFCARGQHTYTVNYTKPPSRSTEPTRPVVRDCPLHWCTCDQGACPWHNEHRKISLYFTTHDSETV